MEVGRGLHRHAPPMPPPPAPSSLRQGVYGQSPIELNLKNGSQEGNDPSKIAFAGHFIMKFQQFSPAAATLNFSYKFDHI